jgi:hypothetical protein
MLFDFARMINIVPNKAKKTKTKVLFPLSIYFNSKRDCDGVQLIRVLKFIF